MKQLEKAIVENGITFVLGKDELYYPDLILPKETMKDIGRYGLIWLRYLQECQRHEYIKLVLAGKLHEHLSQVNEECYERVEQLVEQMKITTEVTEELKRADQMKWVGLVNNMRSAAEEIVLKEIVYNKVNIIL